MSLCQLSLKAIKPLMSKPFPFKYKSTRARVFKKKKKSAEMGYLIWLAAIGLSGAFLKSMQSMQFIPATVADRVICIWCTFSFQQHSLLQFESLQNLVMGLAESLSLSQKEFPKGKLIIAYLCLMKISYVYPNIKCTSYNTSILLNKLIQRISHTKQSPKNILF